MKKILSILREQGMFLSKRQMHYLRAIRVILIYSHYLTHNRGVVFYVKTRQGDRFVEIMADCNIEVSNGYDGGPLTVWYRRISNA